MYTMPVLCEKLPTTLTCSNIIKCVTARWFLEISAKSRVIHRYPAQIPELAISARATLLFCSAETSSGCSSLLVSDYLLRVLCTRAGLL